MIKYNLLSVLFFFNTIILSFGQGYHITLKMQEFTNQPVKLGYYYADKQILAAETTFDSQGKAVFQGSEKLLEGLYRMILPENKHFDLVISKDQQFTMQTDTTDIIKAMQVNGSQENELFYDYQKKAVETNIKLTVWNQQLSKLRAESDSAKELKAAIAQESKKMEKYWKEIAENHPDLFLSKLLFASNGYDPTGFFSNIDYSDTRLLRTPFIYRSARVVLARNLNNFKPIKQIVSEVDKLIEKASVNDTVYQYLTTYFLTFFATFERAGMNEAYVYLSKKYFLDGKAHWMDSTQMAQVEKTYKLFNASSVGKIAPDVEMETVDGNFMALHQVEAKYTLLFFWSYGCGHCEKAAKKIKELCNKNPQYDIEVYAVFTKGSKKDWEEFISKNELNNWIHCWDHENKTNYRMLYYVVSTPILFFLDENKKIIAKRYGDTQIEDLINQLEKQTDKLKKE